MSEKGIHDIFPENTSVRYKFCNNEWYSILYQTIISVLYSGAYLIKCSFIASMSFSIHMSNVDNTIHIFFEYDLSVLSKHCMFLFVLRVYWKVLHDFHFLHHNIMSLRRVLIVIKQPIITQEMTWIIQLELTLFANSLWCYSIEEWFYKKILIIFILHFLWMAIIGQNGSSLKVFLGH